MLSKSKGPGKKKLGMIESVWKWNLWYGSKFFWNGPSGTIALLLDSFWERSTRIFDFVSQLPSQAKGVFIQWKAVIFFITCIICAFVPSFVALPLFEWLQIQRCLMLKTDKFLLRASLKPSTLIRDQFLSTSRTMSMVCPRCTIWRYWNLLTLCEVYINGTFT
jgi:hypothetical protein